MLFTASNPDDIFSEFIFGEGSAAPTEGMQADDIIEAIRLGEVNPKTLSPELKKLVKDRLAAQGVSEADASKLVGDDTTTFYDMENALALGAAKEAGLDFGGPFGASLAASGAPSIVPTPTQQSTIQEETQKLIDIIRQAGGEVKEGVVQGVADLGNLVFQAITLGQAPGPLQAVIPNIMDIIKGGIGGQLVLGGNNQPITPIGTGKGPLSSGTIVGLPRPIGWIVDILRGELPDFGAIVRSLPGTIQSNLPVILASAAAADYDLTPNDKETLVRLGAQPSLLGDDETATGGGETVSPEITDPAIVASTDADEVKVGGLTALGGDGEQVKVGGLTALGGDGEQIKVGGLGLAGADTEQIKVGGLV